LLYEKKLTNLVNNELLVWGTNSAKQELGTGDTFPRQTPVVIDAKTVWNITEDEGIVSVHASFSSFAILTSKNGNNNLN
jgi:hypothetical protein